MLWILLDSIGEPHSALVERMQLQKPGKVVKFFCALTVKMCPKSLSNIQKLQYLNRNTHKLNFFRRGGGERGVNPCYGNARILRPVVQMFSLKKWQCLTIKKKDSILFQKCTFLTWWQQTPFQFTFYTIR